MVFPNCENVGTNGWQQLFKWFYMINCFAIPCVYHSSKDILHSCCCTNKYIVLTAFLFPSRKFSVEHLVYRWPPGYVHFVLSFHVKIPEHADHQKSKRAHCEQAGGLTCHPFLHVQSSTQPMPLKGCSWRGFVVSDGQLIRHSKRCCCKPQAVLQKDGNDHTLLGPCHPN